MTSKTALRRGIDWDKAREILERIAGKQPPIAELKRRFRSGHVYDYDVVEEMENDLVRMIVRRLNNEARSEGRFEQQYFNYVEVMEDGSKKQYYERFDRSTPGGNAGLVRSEFHKGFRQIQKAYEIHDRAVEQFGEEYEQLMMDFMFPPRPSEPADDEDED
jgi:hypothetical protein